MNVLIIGTGYVGLTTGVTLAFLGHQVTCLDVDEKKIRLLKDGTVPFFEPGLENLLALSGSNLKFTSSYEDTGVENSEVIFISVGTPSLPDGSPNLSYVQDVAESIGKHLGSNFTVIVNKSTVPIGSGNWVAALVRDAYSREYGRDQEGHFAVASNPEFLREGSAIYDALYPDRIVVGAEDPRAINTLTDLYRPILNQDFPAPEFLPRPEGLGAVPMVTTDRASAELIKYAANAFLALKISYINEIAQLADRVGADITQIARGIGLDTRIGPRFLQAGIGWGGSCFGKDTAALIATAEEYGLALPTVSASREVNYHQRVWVVEKLLSELKILKGRTIAILGLAFKPQTDDMRDAPSIDITNNLLQRGARVNVHDPVALENAKKHFPDSGIHYFNDVMGAIVDADAVVLVTEWPEYRNLPWPEVMSNMRVPLILDGRNHLPQVELENLGFRCIGVGRGYNG